MAIGGQGLPIPTPSNNGTIYGLPFNFATVPGTNVIALAAGNVYQIPPGWWWYDAGATSALVIRDPISGALLPPVPGIQASGLAATATARTGIINSDGVNYFLVNVKALSVGAIVTAAGTNYVQSSTVVTPTTNSTDSVWHAIVGGSITSITIGNDAKGNVGGTNFTLPPTLIVGQPPMTLANLPSTAVALGGIQAAATCTISANAINAVTVVVTGGAAGGSGAGYLSAPPVQVVPNPFDPNLGIITVPALTAVVGGAGTVTAVVLDRPGTAGGVPTLTITGAGSSATATAYVGIASAATDTIILQWLGGGG
jgi:hypothetical protein